MDEKVVHSFIQTLTKVTRVTPKVYTPCYIITLHYTLTGPYAELVPPLDR